MSAITLGMSDLGRLARSTSVAAIMSERPGVSKTAAESMQELVKRHGALLDDEIVRLQSGEARGIVTDTSKAVQALTEARAALVRAHVTLKDSVHRIEGSSARDASTGVEVLNAAASKLQIADRAVRSTSGVHIISMDNSPFLLRGDEAKQWLATRHEAADLSSYTDGERELITRFKPLVQSIGVGLYGPIGKHKFGTTTTGAHNLEAGRHATLGTIYIGTHHQIVDPPELMRSLRQAGTPALRSLAADGVMQDFSQMTIPMTKINAHVDDLAKAGGMFTLKNEMSNGEIVRAKEVMAKMLDQGQSMLVFPQGHLFPYPGIDGDSLSGAAYAAVQTGAPIQRTTTQGLQSKIDLGPDGAPGRKPLTMIRDALIPRKIDRNSPEFDEAVYQLTEILSQAREADQRLAREMHLRQ